MSTPLTQSQVVQLAYNAGFRGADLVKAVAIAGRESNYRPDAHRTDNPSGNTGDFGLWQINYTNDTPAMRALVGYSDRSQLLDPAINAKVAYAIYARNHGFSSWASGPKGWTANGDPLYGTQKYAQGAAQAVMDFLLGKGDSIAGISVPSVTGAWDSGVSVVTDIGSTAKRTITSVADFLQMLADPAIWMRVLKVVGGVAAIAMGVAILTHADNVVSEAAKVAV